MDQFEARILELDEVDANEPTENGLSYYETAISKCATYICCCPSDKFQPLQKLLLKHVFSESDIRSLFASDLYMFIYRLIHPDFRLPMRQIVMNLCKLAPSERLVKGEALVKRMSNGS